MPKKRFNKEDYIGKTYNRLTVTDIYWKPMPNGINLSWAICDCECGNKNVHKRLAALKNEETRSCGCLVLEARQNRPSGYTVIQSGKSTTELYKVWKSIIGRCSNPNNKKYYQKGIRVCEQWQALENFETWALANGWKPGLTIERIDYNGNYCPENCMWVTRDRQANNKSTNKFLTAFGETKTMADWVRDKRCIVTYATVQQRINKYCWTDIEKVLTVPNTSVPRIITAFGETKKLVDWLKDERCKVWHKKTLKGRIESGWSPEEAITTPTIQCNFTRIP